MVRVIHITDPHIVAPLQKVSGWIDTAQLLQDAVGRILADLPRVGPIDAILVTGDISDNGDPDSYRVFRDIMASIDTPIFVIPGNHDQRDPMRAAFADHAYLPTSGRLNWSVDLNGLNIIGLDTLIEGQGGGVLDCNTLDFLAQALTSVGQGPVLLAMHHPPFASGIGFMDKIGLEGTDRLADIVNAAKADIRIICGHVHSLMIGTVGRATALSGPATCSTFAADFRLDAPVGFMSTPGNYMIHDWSGGFHSVHVGLDQGSGPHPF